MPRIRVLVVDDDPELSAALSETISDSPDLELCGVASDAASAVTTAIVRHPDVVLMDVRMPGGGVAATLGVIGSVPSARVVGLSAHEDEASARQMVEAGAVGYLVKGMPTDEILDAIRRAARGQFSMPAALGVSTVRELASQLRDHISAETALRSSEERMRTLLDAMPDSVIIVNEQGRIDLANSTTQSMFGYAPGELVGQPVETLIPVRMRAGHANLQAAFRQRPRTRPLHSGLELLGRRKEGAEFPVEIALSPMRMQGATSIIAVIRETTELKAAAEMRRKSDELLRDVLESAPNAMVAVDAAGHILVVNRQMEKLFGYTRHELLGMLVDALVPDALRNTHAGHRARFLADPKVRPMGQGLELLARRHDGSEFPVDISLSPLKTEDGIVVIAAVRDITDQKLEQKRQAETQEIAERRRLLAHLVHAQEEERRRIAGDIHDDSIQAMTAVSLRLQQLRKHIDDDAQLEQLAKLDEAVRESISRLRRMMFDLRPAALDRSGLVSALRALLERIGTESPIALTLNDKLGAEPSPEVRIEIYRICQEALVNARKHAAATHVDLTVQRVDNGVLGRVADDGAGFDLAAVEGLHGHLGLVAMRERAEIAGGWWKIDSRVGGGTTVEFWLPDGTDRPEPET